MTDVTKELEEVQAEKINAEEPKVEASDIPPYKFQLSLLEDGQIMLQIGEKTDANINDVLAVAMHIIYDGSKKIYDSLMLEHPELSEDKKQDEFYNILTYCIVTTQMLMYGACEQVFGKFDRTILDAKLKEANGKLDQYVVDMLNKTAKIQDKVVGEVQQDKFGDFHPVNDTPIGTK